MNEALLFFGLFGSMIMVIGGGAFMASYTPKAERLEEAQRLKERQDKHELELRRKQLEMKREELALAECLAGVCNHPKHRKAITP